MSVLSSLAEISLTPFGAIYGAATRARNILYDHGYLPVIRVAEPVISVGNITVGGTGKTPLVEWAARAVASCGRRPCVLTRGYRRQTRAGERVVVSDGAALLADARRGGDEPRLLAENLLGVSAVVADADRVAAARWASENLHSQAFVLDDGFQHRRLARQLNVVVIDATDPWSNGHTLPRGRLREPLSALTRADCLVVSRAEQRADVDSLVGEIARHCRRDVPILISRTKLVALRPLDESTPSDALDHASADLQFGAFCAIGNPESFFNLLRGENYRLSTIRAYPDHYYYTARDAELLCKEARRGGARAIVTTAKDAVKLRHFSFDLPCLVAHIKTDFEPDDAARLNNLVEKAVAI